MKGFYDLNEKFERAGSENCFISEITIAELRFGVENSQRTRKKQESIKQFSLRYTSHSYLRVSVIPMQKKKPGLRKAGTPLDDFDLLICSTAVSYDMTMVTNNLNHFKRIEGISIEDWTK